MFIRNLLWDMGGVLVRFDPALFISRLSLEREDEQCLMREVFRSVEWLSMDRGTLTDQQACERMKRRLPEHLHAYVETLVSHWDEPPLQTEGMEELLQELCDRGYGLYLLSNASRRHHQYWPKYPVSRFFGDRVFISADYGILKPDPAFFETALSHFSLSREDCLFIDDSPPNVEAALRTGIDAVVYHGDVPLLRHALQQRGVLPSDEP